MGGGLTVVDVVLGEIAGVVVVVVVDVVVTVEVVSPPQADSKILYDNIIASSRQILALFRNMCFFILSSLLILRSLVNNTIIVNIHYKK